MFDLHSYSDTYLSGMHDWMSHNGEWPWLQTIIVTPASGNRAAMLSDITGKTTPLLDFFDKQLIPTIDQKYRTNGFKIMSGFRMNGSIVLSALINKPDMFNAYIAISPELKDDYAGILSTASSKLAKLDKKSRFLLFSHGTNVKEAHQMKAYDQLHSIFKKHSTKKLDWHYKHFENNYFMSLPLLSVITGIEKLFNDIHNGLAPDSKVSQKGIDAIIKHYKYLSDHKYGFAVSPKNSINALGFHLLSSSTQAGMKVFKDMIKMFPKDAYSHHNLASAYEKQGDFENAVKHQRDAVKLADNMLGWHKKRHYKFLEDYLSKSGGSSSE
ncbi:hypothetical protein CJF42_10385 [Pseudoalteromonas sp. NBT06-2]|uniref:alpha/beta hydrolase-fold protein n=1 Tax=Pseudoalteromonas sp. NBT06-2 TaxID=2025950 RepID=UPI000BA72C13|nr:hypothetical protein CJF42_10385 [Pseudoalteromonas sp. NBT06-2]